MPEEAGTFEDIVEKGNVFLRVRPDPFRHVEVPPGAKQVKLLGIYYLHVRTKDEGDLYVTKFGLPYLEHLKLKNWREDEWFKSHREKLKGTSTVYKVPSKVVNGRSVNLVVKYCRVGEDVPLDTLTYEKFSDAEFNSPFEEFSLVIEMRERDKGPRIRTNRPLAIYVPPEPLKLWQTGRSKSRMARKTSKYRDVELDILRQYITIYEWVDGLSADEALEQDISDEKERTDVMARLTEDARSEMAAGGFMVIDHKPAHVILRPRPDGTVLKNRTGAYVHAFVDFELLMRTPEFEAEVEMTRRKDYMQHQRDRFTLPKGQQLPEHLRPTTVFNVDYIWGHAESTRGFLWVVGRDPELFDYFLPERWRHTPREKLSKTAETFSTASKDHVKLVWKVSRVGETPDTDPSTRSADSSLAHGYNSPFEEFSIAMDLWQKGFSVVYPRAIYMAGLESPRAQEYVTDLTRFRSHERFQTPEGKPVLNRLHNYITVWGLWQGRFGAPGADTAPPCTGIDLVQAREEGLISDQELQSLLERKTAKLEASGFAADLKPTHFLISRTPEGELIRRADGSLDVTICNFELIRRLHPRSRST